MIKKEIEYIAFTHCPKCKYYDGAKCHYVYCGCENRCLILYELLIRLKNKRIRELKHYIKRKGL